MGLIYTLISTFFSFLVRTTVISELSNPHPNVWLLFVGRLSNIQIPSYMYLCLSPSFNRWFTHLIQTSLNICLFVLFVIFDHSILSELSFLSSKWLHMKRAWNQMFKVSKSTSDTGKVWPLEVGGQRGWCVCSAGRHPKRLFKIKLRKSPTVNIGLGQCHRVWRAKVTLTVSTTALPLVDPKQRAGVNESTVHSHDHEECCPSLCLLILW